MSILPCSALLASSVCPHHTAVLASHHLSRGDAAWTVLGIVWVLLETALGMEGWVCLM